MAASLELLYSSGLLASRNRSSSRRVSLGWVFPINVEHPHPLGRAHIATTGARGGESGVHVPGHHEVSINDLKWHRGDMRCGSKCDLDIWPGAFHSFDRMDNLAVPLIWATITPDRPVEENLAANCGGGSGGVGDAPVFLTQTHFLLLVAWPDLRGSRSTVKVRPITVTLQPHENLLVVLRTAK